jgi:hypothetical protein
MGWQNVIDSPVTGNACPAAGTTLAPDPPATSRPDLARRSATRNAAIAVGGASSRPSPATSAADALAQSATDMQEDTRGSCYGLDQIPESIPVSPAHDQTAPPRAVARPSTTPSPTSWGILALVSEFWRPAATQTALPGHSAPQRIARRPVRAPNSPRKSQVTRPVALSPWCWCATRAERSRT